MIFGCHFHGTQMACHEGGHHHNKDLLNIFEIPLFKGHKAAMDKFSQTVARGGLDLGVVEYVKAWSVSGGHDDAADAHYDGGDIWTKINYELNGAHKTIYVQCHTHHGDTHYSCHYKNQGVNEPVLEDNHAHPVID